MALTQSQIGAWLAEQRKAADVSQRKAAEHLDTDQGTLSRWENGQQEMKVEAFFSLVALYGKQAILSLPTLFATFEKVNGSAAGRVSRQAAGGKRRGELRKDLDNTGIEQHPCGELPRPR